MRARAVCFRAPRTVELVDVDVSGPKEGEVVVSTLWSGISAGSELLAYRGEIPAETPLDETLGALAGTFAFPFSYGYSCVGRVERGPLPEGSLVFGFHAHQDRFVVPAADAIVVDGVDPRLATIFPLVETALQVSLDVEIAAGDVRGRPVVVVGLGAVGILTAALLLRSGASVIACDERAERRSLAGGAGLTEVTDPASLPAVVGDATARRGVPVVIEATGDPDALAASLPLLAREGYALVASWYGAKEATLPLGREFHRRRLTIRSTQVSTIPASIAGTWTIARRRAVARDLLTELPLAELATHAVPFERAADAFAALDRGEPGLLHMALSYR